MDESGIVFNLQRFSTHDGPGIRTTVFLKGCPLSCPWCANPESQSPSPQLMVRDSRCVGCGECAAACSEGAISLPEGGKRRIEWDRCTQCFDCVDACLQDALAIVGERMTPQEVLATAKRDRVFYRNSGGGVTLSGGEPLAQDGFVESLLDLLREERLHAALDTAGHAPAAVFDRILPKVDLVLFDIKLLDESRHKELTGVGNALILENARRAAASARTWFRVPLLAGLNDGIDDVARLADLALELGVEKVSFLPYHQGGVAKWRQIGGEGPDFEARAPDRAHIERLTRMVSRKGLLAGVGS
jgi:pyruvate formate lyase activating enzyme